MIIEAKGISKKYGNLEVLKSINLEIEKGEIISIVGASGAGKSTLLHILGTLEKPDDGSLLINHTDLFKLNEKKLAHFRNQHLGFVFQFHHLLPEFTALENVCFPGFIAGKPKKYCEERAKFLLENLGLSERINHKPNQLSGGEQQRVAVCRALMNEPAVIFADEPSGNLDSHSAITLHDLFFDLRKRFNQTFVIVTHNETLANRADRKLTIVDGRIA